MGYIQKAPEKGFSEMYGSDVLERPYTVGGRGGPPHPLDPPPHTRHQSDYSGEKTKFPIGKIWSAFFGTQTIGSQTPSVSAPRGPESSVGMGAPCRSQPWTGTRGGE